MNLSKVYLDTSVISALLDERTPERMAMTEAAWTKLSEYDVWISDLVIDELNLASMPLRECLLRYIKDFGKLAIDEQATKLARQYVRQGIFPDAYYDDALHVALASVNGISYLLSWNYRHLVKVKTRRLVALANALFEYPAVEIIAPPEL